MEAGATPQKESLKKILNLYRDYHAKALIRPLLEFKAIHPQQINRTWNLTTDKDGTEELKKILEGRKGLYVFYDSSGRVIYVGKSVTSLFLEIKQRLKAIVNRPFYGPTRMANPVVGTLARFVSAYEVIVPNAIRNLESFLLRSFANDIMNKNSGNFKDPV